jgi:TonB family protein
MIDRAISHYRILRKLRGGAVVVISLLCLAPEAKTQEQKLDELAGETATAISGNVQAVAGTPKVLVLDFSPLHQGPGGLGSKLADQFSDSLKRQARGFVVMDRADYFARSGDKSSNVSYGDDLDAMECQAGQPGPNASAFVEGFFDLLPDDAISVWVKVLKDEKSIFAKRITLTLTPELRGLASTPVQRRNDSHEPIVWTSTDRPQSAIRHAIRLPDDSDPRFKLPTCLHCPNPSYSDAASAAKIQGTVKFDVEIDADGFPVQVMVIQGLPCGLTSKAIEAVAHWKFNPALGPDGKPLAVIVPVEVTFRLF